MAKPKDTPALTAARAWKAIVAGSLKVEPVYGTRMLRVIGGRLRLTWTKRDGKKRQSKRITLSKGSYLNPRWIEITDEADIQQLLGFTREGLASQGILQTPEGVWRRLIYQQVEDALHLERQVLEHILPQYDQEEEELWALLDQIATQPAEDLRGTIDQRFMTIQAIRPHMAGRGAAVASRLKFLLRKVKHLNKAIETLLLQAPLGEKGGPLEGQNLDGAILGMTRSLNGYHKELELVEKEKPLRCSTSWARWHLKKAIDCLQAKDFLKTADHLQRTLIHLGKVIENLEKEK